MIQVDRHRCGAAMTTNPLQILIHILENDNARCTEGKGYLVFNDLLENAKFLMLL